MTDRPLRQAAQRLTCKQTYKQILLTCEQDCDSEVISLCLSEVTRMKPRAYLKTAFCTVRQHCQKPDMRRFRTNRTPVEPPGKYDRA